MTATDIFNFGVKSQLAKLMASENLTMEHRPGISTAWFDIKNRQLVLPVWQGISEDLYDMLITHETGHALNTPMEDWKGAIESLAKKHHPDPKIAKRAEANVQGFLNVIEDARIDKLQKRRYPGSKRNYLAGYAELHDRDFFSLKKERKDLNTLTFIDRANIFFKGGYLMNIDFTQEEQAFIKRMEEAETFADVVAIADDVYAYARSKNQFEQQTTGTKVILKDAEDCEDGEGTDPSEIDWDNVDEIEDQRKDKGKGKSDKGKDKDDKDDDKSDKAEKSDKKKDKKEPKKTKAKGDKSEEGDESDEDGGDADGGSDGDEDEEDEKGSGKGKSSEGDDDDAEGDDDDDGEEGGADADKGGDKKAAKPSDKKDDKKSKEEASSSTSGKGDRQSAEKQKKSEKEGTQGDSQMQVPDDFIPKSMTEEAAQASAESIVMKTTDTYVYVKTPDLLYDNIINDFKVVIPQQEAGMVALSASDRTKHLEELRVWRQAENDTISFMVKEFEMRKSAEMHSRQKIAKTGVIDTNKMHSYLYNDDIFRRMTTVPEGKNHGFVMLLDWSSSMRSHLRNTLKQILSQVFFCKRVGIPFDLYSFREPVGNDSPVPCQMRSPGTLAFGTFRLRNLLSSRMNTSMFNRALNNLWLLSAPVQCGCEGMTSTPLNQAIFALDKVVLDFQKKNRVQIVSTIIFTDGESNCDDGVINEPNPAYSVGGAKRYFLRDTKTNKNYSLPSLTGSGATRVYLDILKDRTQSNLIGFYLLSGLSSARQVVADPKVLYDKSAETFFKDNGFLNVTSGGYDDYFLISTEKIKEKDGALAVKAGATAEDLKTAFSTFNAKKTVNRILLKQFVARIATEHAPIKK
jgi:hypothetical protein